MALVSLLRQFDRSLFDFVAVFLLQQFLIEVTSKFWDSAVSPYPWKRQAKKWRHWWSWSINLLGSRACSQRPSANKRSKMPDVCANLRACRQLAGQCFRSWNTKTCAASSPHSVVAGLCPLMLTSSWTKKARNPQKRELVPSSTLILSGFYLFQSYQKATGSFQVGRLSKHSSQLGKPLVNLSVGMTHTVHSDQHFIEQLSGNEPASEFATVWFFNSAVALSPCNRIFLGMSTPLCSSTLALMVLHRWHVDQCQV